MHFVLDSSYQNEAAQENNEKSILEAVIQCNNGKLKSLKQELHTQRELNSKIRDNIDSFVRISSKVGKAMAERDE